MQQFDEALTTGAHRRRDLLAAGVTDAELRGPLWERSSYGRYAWAATDASHPRQRIHAAASRCGDGEAVAGWAAAWLHGARELDGAGPAGTDALAPVPICTTPDRRLVPRGTGRVPLRVSRSRLDPHEIVQLDSQPCTNLVRTAFDVARFAPDLSEAVVALDALLGATDLRLQDVVDYAGERRRWRGRPQVLQATALASARALSCPESRLRMVWQLRAGLPAPLVNVTIADSDGRPIAMADLFDEEAWLVLEYDGAYHAAAHQRGLDDQRTQRLHAWGLHVARFVAQDLHPSRQQATANRLRALRRRRLQEVAGRRAEWAVLPQTAIRPVQ
jgi:hypothetical protein